MRHLHVCPKFEQILLSGPLHIINVIYVIFPKFRIFFSMQTPNNESDKHNFFLIVIFPNDTDIPEKKS